MKRVLITGAAGFIGFHVASACLAAGLRVIGLDNFAPYYSVELKRRRAELLAEAGLSIIEQDLGDKKALVQLVQREDISHVIHLAAQAGIRHSIACPEQYVAANIAGFLHVLEACRERLGTRLLYASSSSVYGTNEKVPFAVGDRTDDQANFYGVTKKTNELMAACYEQLFGIQAIGLRFFTVYGPWGRPDMAYFSFTKAVMQGEEVPIYGNGTMKRDFTYIDDIVRGVMRALAYEGPLRLFNLGNNRPQSVLALITAIERATGKQAKKRFLPVAKGEIDITYADIAPAAAHLGFVPKMMLDEGIERFVKWSRAYAA